MEPAKKLHEVEVERDPVKESWWRGKFYSPEGSEEVSETLSGVWNGLLARRGDLWSPRRRIVLP